DARWTRAELGRLRSAQVLRARIQRSALEMMEAIDMKRNALFGLTTAVCLCTAASSASAHHSHPYVYDECKSITIEGRVERVEFKDPHTLIVLRLDDGTAFTVDWAPVS